MDSSSSERINFKGEEKEPVERARPQKNIALTRAEKGW